MKDLTIDTQRLVKWEAQYSTGKAMETNQMIMNIAESSMRNSKRTVKTILESEITAIERYTNSRD
jgi:hypothetical protein